MTKAEAAMILGGVRNILKEPGKIGNQEIALNSVIIVEALNTAIATLNGRTESGIVIPN